MAEENKKRDGFGSKLGIIAAAAGSAVGLGNICRFPCELGETEARLSCWYIWPWSFCWAFR